MSKKYSDIKKKNIYISIKSQVRYLLLYRNIYKAILLYYQLITFRRTNLIATFNIFLGTIVLSSIIHKFSKILRYVMVGSYIRYHISFRYL